MTKHQLDLDFFEKVVVHKCLTDSRYLSSVIEHAEPRFFNDKNITTVYQLIKGFFNRRSTVPTNTEILALCNTPELRASFKNVLKSIKNIDTSINEDELISNTERFLKEKAVYHTMMDVANDCSAGNIDPSLIYEKFERCTGIDLTLNMGYDFLQDVNPLINDLTQIEPVISTGLEWLDHQLDGGFLANGRAMYIFAGETNIGKSIVLGNIACNIAKQGKTVLLISLEMSEMMYARRLASNISGIEVNSLKHETDALRISLQQFKDNNPKSRLLIKEFPPSTITVPQLRSFISKIAQAGVKIDAIVVDYLNLIYSPIGNNSYERVKYVGEQSRALTYTYSCPLISATQLNRTGYDTQNPSLDTISESMGLAMTADAIFSVFQSPEDKDLDIIRMGKMKNRFGSNHGTHEFSINYPTLTITDGNMQNINDLSYNVVNAIELLGN